MTNSQPPLSPNSAVGSPESPVPKWSAFNPIAVPAPESHVVDPYPQPISPISEYSTSSYSTAWSPPTNYTLSSPSSPDSPLAQGPRRYREDDPNVQDLFIDRSYTEQGRLKGAKNRSLELLDQYAESGTKYKEMQALQALQAVPFSYSNDGKKDNGKAVNGFIERSITEKVRHQEAKQRSLALLETCAESARKSASEASQADKEYREKMKSIPREDEIYDLRKTFRRKNMHMMASSTRKKKPSTPAHAHDPETVAGMKNQLDIDREKAAEKKALLLLDITAMF